MPSSGTDGDRTRLQIALSELHCSPGETSVARQDSSSRRQSWRAASRLGQTDLMLLSLIEGEADAADWLFVIAVVLFIFAAIVTRTTKAAWHPVLLACGLAALALGFLVL